jgi:hypothetical protein
MLIDEVFGRGKNFKKSIEVIKFPPFSIYQDGMFSDSSLLSFILNPFRFQRSYSHSPNDYFPSLIEIQSPIEGLGIDQFFGVSGSKTSAKSLRDFALWLTEYPPGDCRYIYFKTPEDNENNVRHLKNEYPSGFKFKFNAYENRLFWAMGGGSHHFAAIYRHWIETGRKTYFSGTLTEVRVHEGELKRCLENYHYFAMSYLPACSLFVSCFDSWGEKDKIGNRDARDWFSLIILRKNNRKHMKLFNVLKDLSREAIKWSEMRIDDENVPHIFHLNRLFEITQNAVLISEKAL